MTRSDLRPDRTLLSSISCPADLRGLTAPQLADLAGEIRDLLVETLSRTGGHLGPNLGVVELTLALHRVFHSPDEPILWDVGHQAYVHKIVTGRAAEFATLRQYGGLSGYPNRAESEHDWIENSHASTALSHADGLAKARELRGDRRPVVVVVGDGALTGGMCWEALNNIAGSGRPVVIVVNDNGRSYAETVGGLGRRLSAVRLQAGYERFLDKIKDGLPSVPVVGRAAYSTLHGVKAAVKDVITPQGLFADLGLKYLGPIDGHDISAVEEALRLARDFGAPVLVHCLTVKGHGYPYAEGDPIDQVHQCGPFDLAAGPAHPAVTGRWTDAFAEELVALGHERSDVVAVSAAMCESTGLGAFAQAHPDRCFDVGIAEQHAVTFAAGLASGGLHPVVAIYATFLNRAFDQTLLDVALHRLPVTFVLDRAGITGEDGPSHHGVWDLAVLGVVPGLRLGAPRDATMLRTMLREAVAWQDGPTAIRFPKATLAPAIPALRSADGIDVLAEPDPHTTVDVLLVAIGAMAADALDAAEVLATEGITARVVDPRWLAAPVRLSGLARQAHAVMTVEDGVAIGGAGSRLIQQLRCDGVDVPARTIGVPTQFLPHGTVAQIRQVAGLTGPAIAARARTLVAGPNEPAGRYPRVALRA